MTHSSTLHSAVPDGRAEMFAPTQWSMVLAAGGRGGDALEKLCRAYWPPIFAHLRRLGHPSHDAQDLAQEFFSRLLAGDSLGGAVPEKGRFRSWMLGALKHFLMNHRRDAAAQKRGGGHTPFSLSALPRDLPPDWEPRDDLSPDVVFERRWAETVLLRIAARLRRDYEAAGQPDRFAVLKQFLPGDGGAESYAAAAEQLGLSEAAVRAAIYRIRQRYGELLRAEIAQTVGSPAEVEDEIRCLLAALRR